MQFVLTMFAIMSHQFGKFALFSKYSKHAIQLSLFVRIHKTPRSTYLTFAGM